MKLIVLCVDGLDYEYMQEIGFPRLPYEKKLSIPDELCLYDPKHGLIPHTIRIWASILSGRVIETDFPTAKLPFYRRIPRAILHSMGVSYRRHKSNHVHYSIYPENYNIETILDNYNSVSWNIPTINPEWIFGFLNEKINLDYCRREFKLWKLMIESMRQMNYDLSMAYCRIIDGYAHRHMDVESLYLDVHFITSTIRNTMRDNAVMLISDHATDHREGEHRQYAYFGCNRKINADSVLEIRNDMEGLLNVY